MSAILPGAPDQFSTIQGSLGRDGIRRYKTRCKVLIDSHNVTDPERAKTEGAEGTLELFDDVYAVDTSKTLKGPGQATVTLTPSLNYLNLIFPNDYINIYFDIGDGAGWTRTFFGFVDRIEESYVVEKSGVPKTTYRLVCTDFFKAFERTMIYFNPHLSGRRDFVGYDFNANNVGGLALINKGIVAGGSPPDVVVNILQLLIGFGTQFLLPPSYHPGDTQRLLREARRDLVYGQFNQKAIDALNSVQGNYTLLREEANADAALVVSTYKPGDLSAEEARIRRVADKLGEDSKLSIENLYDLPNTELIKLVADKLLSNKLGINPDDKSLVGTDDSQHQANAHLLESIYSSKSSLSDILDTFTFIERRSMDGYLFGQPVWQKQGSLISILRSFSNEAVNELFFDLRPLNLAPEGVEGPGLTGPVLYPAEGEYATTADDKKGNVGDETARDGITYIPAVVMREYPFSTIDGLDLRNVNLQLKGEDGKKVRIGLLYFGDIFATKPNIPGRHVIAHPNINIADRFQGYSTSSGLKHLDVAVISEEEIVRSTLGRSDNDHFNLFEFWSDNVLGSDMKFYMQDMLPIITPIHILRNGIRVRSVTTRAARFSLESMKNLTSAAFELEIKKIEDKVSPAGERVDIDPANIFPPVVVDPDIVRISSTNPGTIWGYRHKVNADEDIDHWIYHQGVDIYKRKLENIPASKKDKPIQVRAIADGEVVIAAPEDVYDGYGNIVVIKHDFGGDVGIKYSVYAHLDSIHARARFGPLPKVGKRGTKSRYCVKGAAPGVSKGRHKKGKKISKGDIIGIVGNSGTSHSGTPNKFHLHFEIDRHFPPRDNNVTPRIPYEPNSFTPPYGPGITDPSGGSNALMASTNQKSCDPISFYDEVFGINLVGAINGGEAETIDDYLDDAEIDLGDDSAEERGNRTKESTKQEHPDLDDDDPPKQLSDRKLVDTASSRSQIIRWALLQDHWYQHNLEYLSGRIDMRGAPEIRVGYRLDIKERDMSCYVEGVNHKWTFPNSMTTNLAVSRGQANNPFPLYVYPNSYQMNTPESQRRTSASRLATYFLTPDPVAIRRSLFIRGGRPTAGGAKAFVGGVQDAEGRVNTTDAVDSSFYDGVTQFHEGYNEIVKASGSNEVVRAMEEARNSETDAFELTPPSDQLSLDSLTGQDSTPSLSKDDEFKLKLDK